MTQPIFPEKHKDDGVERQRKRLTFRGNVKAGRHGWLRLTPAYSLHVVNEILETHSTSDFVLDPFSGTGTTPLASAVHGTPGHSVDVNPFLVWIGNLKAQKFGSGLAESLETSARKIATGMRRRKNWAGAWQPDIHQIEKWWDEPILDALSQLHASIAKMGEDDSVVRDLLTVAFCRTLIGTSHASFGHQSMSFKKKDASQPSLFGATPDEMRKTVIDRFIEAASDVAASLTSDQPTAEAKVFLGDSRRLDLVLPKDTYTAVITSPPYPNRMSYIRELRPYMYWTKHLATGREAGELDWKAIGGTWGCATSNLGKWEADPKEEVPHGEFERIVETISVDHVLLGKYVHKYFEDIKVHVRSLKRVVKSGARCYYIVGNSKFYGTLLPTEKIYESLFKDAGFKNTRIDCIRKRNSKKELFEYVVYAEAP